MPPQEHRDSKGRLIPTPAVAMYGIPPIQTKMLDILSDGLPHSREELRVCLSDSQAEIKNIYPHLSLLRKRIRERGEAIMVEFVRRKLYFRHVRLLASAYDGYT